MSSCYLILDGRYFGVSFVSIGQPLILMRLQSLSKAKIVNSFVGLLIEVDLYHVREVLTSHCSMGINVVKLKILTDISCRGCLGENAI